MKYKVRLTEKAERDVDRTLAWFGEQGAVEAAGKWLAQLFRAIDTLETMPARCGLAAEAAEIELEIRELLVGKRSAAHRLLFEIDDRSVFVLRIWHTARDRVTRADL